METILLMLEYLLFFNGRREIEMVSDGKKKKLNLINMRILNFRDFLKNYN